MPDHLHTGGLRTSTALSMISNACCATPFSSSSEDLEVLLDGCDDIKRDANEAHAGRQMRLSPAPPRIRSHSDTTAYQTSVGGDAGAPEKVSHSSGSRSSTASPDSEIKNLQNTLRKVKRKNSFVPSGAWLGRGPKQSVGFFRHFRWGSVSSDSSGPPPSAAERRGSLPQPQSTANNMDEACAKSSSSLYRPARSQVSPQSYENSRQSTDSRASCLTPTLEQAVDLNFAKAYPSPAPRDRANSRGSARDLDEEFKPLLAPHSLGSIRSAQTASAHPSFELNPDFRFKSAGATPLLSEADHPAATRQRDAPSSGLRTGWTVPAWNKTSKGSTSHRGLLPLVIPRQAPDGSQRVQSPSCSATLETQSAVPAAPSKADGFTEVSDSAGRRRTPTQSILRRLPCLQLGAPPLSPGRVRFASTVEPASLPLPLSLPPSGSETISSPAASEGGSDGPSSATSSTAASMLTSTSTSDGSSGCDSCAGETAKPVGPRDDRLGGDGDAAVQQSENDQSTRSNAKGHTRSASWSPLSSPSCVCGPPPTSPTSAQCGGHPTKPDPPNAEDLHVQLNSAPGHGNDWVFTPPSPSTPGPSPTRRPLSLKLKRDNKSSSEDLCRSGLHVPSPFRHHNELPYPASLPPSPLFATLMAYEQSQALRRSALLASPITATATRACKGGGGGGAALTIPTIAAVECGGAFVPRRGGARVHAVEQELNEWRRLASVVGHAMP